MQRTEPSSNRQTRRSRNLRGIWGKLDDVVITDMFGDMGWMIVLGVAVLLLLGFVYLISLVA